MRNLFFSLIMCFTLQPYSQLVPDKTSYDFGIITEDSMRTVDFIVTNKYNKRVSPRVVGFDLNISTRQYPYSIEPDSSTTFRFKLNPNKKGLMEKQVKITMWDTKDTLILTLKANVKSFDYAKNGPAKVIERPREPNEEVKKEIAAKFRVVDKKTKKVIPNANISFSSMTLPYKRNLTDQNGELTKQFLNGYRISIMAPGYKYYSGKMYLGCEDSVRTITLEPYSFAGSGSFSSGNRVEPEQATKDMNEVFKDMSDAEILKPLDEDHKPNNIVFLMDVSFSMIEENRIGLLQTSIINMIKVLRPEDRVAIITFASETKVLFKSLPATKENKRKMIRAIENLLPRGLTDGGKGLEMAYDLIDKNFKSDGNNQLVLVTDGGLNDYMRHKSLIRKVESYAEKTTTSVLMIHGYSWAYTYMGEIAAAGNGHLLPINSTKDSEGILIKEIKLNSKKE